jgi:tetratricopeptide (TPR) repeat protein
MAKQRPTPRVAPKKTVKASPRPAAKPAVKPAAKPGKASSKAAGRTAPAVAAKKPSAVPAVPVPAQPKGLPPKAPVPAPPPARNLAVETFEKGFRAMQQRQFDQAAALFQEVIASWADEKELVERARVYLAVCARQVTPPDATPKSFEERVYAATLLVNKGAHQEGLTLLTALERERPQHDHVQYLLAVARAQLGDTPAALAHLRKAIGIKPSVRRLAAQDGDLEPLRTDPEFDVLLEASSRGPAGSERSGR